MSIDDQVDLGANDYSPEGEGSGFEQFLSKPVQRQYQPFGGQIQRKQSSVVQPQYAQPEIEEAPQSNYQDPFDEGLDVYDQTKKYHGQISQFARENERSAKHYEKLYDEFKENKFLPFYKQFDDFSDYENDDDYISSLDSLYKADLKAGEEEDGFFGGESDSKKLAEARLGKYAAWNQPNGIRDQFLRLKNEKEKRRAVADQAKQEEYRVFEGLTSIPIPMREQLDQRLKARSAKPKSKRATDELLSGFEFEDPIADMKTGEIVNLEKVDPRKKLPGIVDMKTGETSNSYKAQQKRLEAARRGDIEGFTQKRQLVAKDRQLRDKGFIFSQAGTLDNRPIGLSRKDVDILDIEEMSKAGITSYKGKPLDQAMEELGGEEKLNAAKIMQAVYAAKSEYEKANLDLIKVIGGDKADKAREKLEVVRQKMQQTVSLAAEYGLDNELFEQAETTSWLGGLGNAIKRGALMSEMSNYTPDFLTNTLDVDEMEKFIQIASQIEKLPTSTAMKRVKSTKSDGFLDAVGNLLFDNPAAIPEMFVESLSSFLPATIKWLIPSAGVGALAGSAIAPGPGTATGALYGARASWGVASFVLEASGMALEGMQELGIDWQNPKVFAAAWTNETIRKSIQKKMVQKGAPIAAADMLTGFMAGKVMGVANHTGNAVFKGGQLLNKSQFEKSMASVPRFTAFQKTRNAAAELGFDSLMGMSGEYLGQWASKEPGEEWDWDAIAAEGLVGVGPGVLSSAMEMRGRKANYFANAPIEISGEQATDFGSSGTVTRAGYSAPYQTFNDADSMVEYFSTLPNANPESLEFTRDWVQKLYETKPEEMSKLKIAVSPRTPDANMENRGTFEARDGHSIIYLNEKEFAADPMATFMHEAGHFARVATMDQAELMKMWSGIGRDAQLDAYAQYFTKQDGVKFEDLNDSTKSDVEKAFKKTDDDVLAEEWFSYQFAQVLQDIPGVDPVIKGRVKSYKKELGKAFATYTGTDSKDSLLYTKIANMLKKGPDAQTTSSSANPPAPKVNSDPQAALNAMPGTPKEKSRIAKALNAMAGQKILTESPSFYTNMQRGAAIAASKDIEDIDENSLEVKDVKDTLPKLKEKQKVSKPDRVRARKDLDPPAGVIPGESKEPTVESKPASALQKDKNSGKVRNQSQSEIEIETLDRILPKTEEEAASIRELNSLLNQNKKKFTTVQSLDKAIGEAITKFKKEDIEPSVTQIISEVLNLETLLQLAPISFVSELQKAMNPTASRSKLPSNNDIEDMAIEARDRVETVKESLRLRLAEIDREIESLKPGAEGEVSELAQKRRLVRLYLDFVAPEEASIDWMDVPHNLMSYRRYRMVKGKKVYSPDMPKPEPVTLGMLATMRSWQNNDDKGLPYPLIEYKVQGQKKDISEDKRSPQEYLWDYVNHEFKPPKTDKKDAPKPFYGGKSENEYRMILEAVKASAMYPKQQNIATESIGDARWEVEAGVKQEARRGYPSGYMSEKGTNFGLLIAERIREKGLKGVEQKGDRKTYPKFDLESVNPTIPEAFALMMANGRTLELLGDPSDSMKDFDRALFTIAREELKSELLGDLGTDAMTDALENQFEYAEESGDPFIKVEPGAPLSKTLSAILSIKARMKFERDYRDYVIENTQSDVPEFKRFKGSLPPDIFGNPDRPTAVIFKELNQYIDKLKSGSVTVDGRKVPVPEDIIESLESYKKSLAYIDLNRKTLSEDLNSALDLAQGGVSIPQQKFVVGFKVPPESQYNFRSPGSNVSEPVPAKGDHGAFTAGDIFTTFDVMTAFSKGRLSPDTAADVLLGLKSGFKKERTNVGKSEIMPARPINMKREESDLLSSTDINAVDFANWYLKGDPIKQMEALQFIPSSKVKDGSRKQLPGGLGEGLLPYVFNDFITAMYENLNIQRANIKIKDDTNKKNFRWRYDQGKMTMGGELVDFSMFSDKDGNLHPEVMAALAKPVVQAVIDAEGVDVYGQFDSNSENMLQRDTQKGQSFDEDNSADTPTETDDTDSGVQAVQAEGLQAEALDEATQKAVLDRISEDESLIRDSSKLDDGIIQELLSSENLTRDLRDALLDEYARRQNFKEFDRILLNEEPRTLNSDAGKPINDLNVVRKIIALTKKRIPFTRIAELGSQWDYDELSEVYFKARDRRTYEGGKSDVQVAEELLESLKSARAAMAEGDAERAQQETAFIEKLMSNDMVMNNKWSDINDDPEAIDLQVEAEGFGGSISDLITKARKFKKDGTSPRTLNSDAGRVLTSDVNPNLKKATLLSKIAGDRELKKEFKDWAATRKESYDKGSFRMNMIDRMSPVKLLSQSSLEVFEKLGLKKGSLLHNWLDVHGRSHQYFGKGGNGLEQSRLDYYDPLTEIMRKHDVTQKKAGEYLIARAAPSRNLQIEAKAEEVLADMRKEDEQGKGKEYKKLYDFYYDKDGNFIRNSGVETKKALEVMADMESKPEFVEFLKEFLPVYYGMNKDGLDQLSFGELIMSEIRDAEDNKIQSIDEKTAMITAASRFDFNTGKADKYGNKFKSKVKIKGNYAYSPLQGFEGETEQFFDQEEAWEEFGSKSTGAGKGFNQPKGAMILQGAFGRKSDGVKSYGPDPETVVGNAINQHTSAMIRAKKNEVSKSFGNMYALLYSVLNPNKQVNKDSSEFFDFANQDPQLKEIFDTLQTIHEPGNEKLLEELTTEFNKVFDKPFEPSETKMAYELKTDDAGIADSRIGLVRRTLSNEFKNDQNVFVFRRAGQPYFIRFNPKTDEGLRMADAMNNLRYESLPPILGGFNVGTRLMAKMFTSANLAFILPNFFRDVLTARIHLSEDNKKVLIKDALNHKNLAGFMKSIYQTEADIKNGINPNRKEEISKILALRDPKKILESGNRQAMYQYYKENGGKVDMFRHPTLVEKIKDIQKSLDGKDGWTKASWKKFWDFVDTANTAVENSIRASTFWAAIKEGRGPDEAAVIARNVTVDFNQKGNLTQTFGSLYVFFGASMNSIDRFFTTFSRRSPKERAKLIAGIAGAAFIINILNRLMDDDEDEEMPDYDTISSYKRDTNAILPLPAGLPEFFNDEKDTGFFSLPLPLGYNLFWTMGQVMGDMFAKNVFGRGGAGLVEATTRFTDSAMSAFNPVGGSSGLAVALTPTPFVPLIELYANKNFMGSPIRYADRPFEVPKPGHMQDPKGTPEHWNKLSKAINSLMGGSDDVKGSFAGMLGNNPLYYRSDEDITFDISGNQLRHAVMGYLGGPGQKADALFGALFSAGSGKPSIENVNDVPIVNRFLRATTYGSATRGTFYEIRDAIKNAEKAVKSAKNISPSTYTAVLNDNRELLKLSAAISQLDKQKNKMRRLRKQIESSKKLSEEQKTQRVDDIQRKELNLMVTVIKKAQSLGIS